MLIPPLLSCLCPALSLHVLSISWARLTRSVGRINNLPTSIPPRPCHPGLLRNQASIRDANTVHSSSVHPPYTSTPLPTLLQSHIHSYLAPGSQNMPRNPGSACTWMCDFDLGSELYTISFLLLERQPLGPSTTSHARPAQVLFGCSMHTAFPSSMTLERRGPPFETVAGNVTY